jgi:predicted GNAT superfamily acetyltransferase
MAAFDGQLRPYYYSHMLAVRPESRNGGIGHRLKLEQRSRALRLGVPLITWTYDPLQSRNAYLNLVKLGGVVRRYKVNYYGNRSTSVLHRGLDTDRLLVEWWVQSDRVERALAGGSPPGMDSAMGTAGPVEKVEIPREIEEIKGRDLAEAHQWQRQVREKFLSCFERGLYCTGLETSPTGSSWYLFSPDEREEERQWRGRLREQRAEKTRWVESPEGHGNSDGWFRPGEDAEELRKETR